MGNVNHASAVTGESLVWMRHGLCAISPDPDLWFPETGGSQAAAEAKAVCVRCPVRAQCLDYAVALGIRHGVWGGTTPEERDGRKARRQNRRRGPRTRREAAQALENEAG
jgi:WhiB family redox-sensing transcriptional regulator